jgi:hypothetical protein
MVKKQKNVVNNPKKGFQEIWRQHPEWQNWSSSSWWFFLFLPKQEHGYGPKQMMFAFASRRGDLCKFKSKWSKGLDPNRRLGKTEKFITPMSGWIHDGKQVHDEILLQTNDATLSYDKQFLDAWEIQDDGSKYGARIESSRDDSHEYAIDGHFIGKRGEAKFTIWNSGSHYLENPQIVTRNPKQWRFGGVQYIPWRRFAFEGEFTSPSGTETLSGLGYFQRVLMNIPMFPWSWCYIIFEDGSIFSSFMINFGFHNFNRKEKHNRQFLERFKYNVKPRSFYYDPNTGKTYHFDSSRTIPIIHKLGNPDFYIEATMDDGDFLRFKLKSHGHAQFTLDRRIIKHLWQSKYFYDEYMVKVVGVKGKIGGKKFDTNEHGQGWGNIEYTHGMSL